MPELRTLTTDDLAKLSAVTLDLNTVTMGEAAEAERESGWSIGEIVKSPSARRVLAMFIHGLRHYDVRPSWKELASLRAVDVSQSTSHSQSDSPSETSKA